jgi:L-lactate dehydrogenase complex protein LldG
MKVRAKDAARKEKILKKLRRSLVEKTKEPFPSIDYESNVFTSFNDMPEIEFAQRFTDQGGKFVFCESYLDLAENLNFLINDNKWEAIYCQNKELTDALIKENFKSFHKDGNPVEPKVCLTTCELLVARTGSILITEHQVKYLHQIANAEVHLVVAKSIQLVEEVKDALKKIKTTYTNNYPAYLTFIAGPSKTSDLESTTVIGAQGPREVYLFLMD